MARDFRGGCMRAQVACASRFDPTAVRKFDELHRGELECATHSRVTSLAFSLSMPR
jgi:hypothetical protein